MLQLDCRGKKRKEGRLSSLHAQSLTQSLYILRCAILRIQSHGNSDGFIVEVMKRLEIETQRIEVN